MLDIFKGEQANQMELTNTLWHVQLYRLTDKRKQIKTIYCFQTENQ